MNLFQVGGGSKPWFANRFTVERCSTEMFEWLTAYPLQGPFERFYVEWRMDGYDIITIESNRAAYMFKIAFSEHILHEQWNNSY